MAEYTHDTLDKVIKEQEEKIHSYVQTLRLKHVQRERLESEIVGLKSTIQEAEDFVKLMQGIQNAKEDKEIVDGLKAQRRKKRGE
jgi:hypothetical protein